MKTPLVFIAMLLTACTTQPTQESPNYGASVGIVNHTGKFIYSATVDGAGGGNMPAWGAGYGNVCCASVPRKWRPGVMVLVRWDMPDGSKHIYKEKVVEVEKYDETGSIYMHFFQDDRVRVVVSPYDGASHQHPITRPQKPSH